MSVNLERMYVLRDKSLGQSPERGTKASSQTGVTARFCNESVHLSPDSLNNFVISLLV